MMNSTAHISSRTALLSSLLHVAVIDMAEELQPLADGMASFLSGAQEAGSRLRHLTERLDRDALRGRVVKHEMRNELNTMTALADLLKEELATDPRFNGNAERRVDITIRLGAELMAAISEGHDAPTRTEKQPTVPRRTTKGPMRVLIADDSKVTRRILRWALAGLNLEFTEASDGDEAMALTQTSQFDLVLLDLNMPGTRSETVMDHVMKQPSGRAPKIFVVSGMDDPKLAHRLMSKGVTQWIQKPIAPKLLKQRVASTLKLVHTSKETP